MSTEEMAQFLSVCVMPPKKTRTQTKTRKNNKKATQVNSSKV
jgi:hypothetical protein